MIFEAIVRCPSADRYEQHLYLVERMGPFTEPYARHWLWRGLGTDAVMVRSAKPIGDFDWHPVAVPESGRARILLEAHVRRNRNDRQTGKRTRPSRHDYVGRLHWFRDKGEQFGFEVQGLEVQDATAWIGKKPPNRPFDLHVSVYVGVITITNPVSLEYAMLRGIGNAKAYGFGFMIVSPIGGGQRGKQKRPTSSPVRVRQSSAADSVLGVSSGQKGRAARNRNG